MLLPITDYYKALIDKGSAITASEMLHNLHQVGTAGKSSVPGSGSRCILPYYRK